MSSAATPDIGAGTAPAATVAVVGGGIAGLSAAWALSSAAPAVRVVVLESDERLGGKLRTGAIGGRAVDLGPDAFLVRRPEAVDLCRELGLGDDLISPGSRTAYVWARGRLRPLPGGLALGVPTRLGPLARSGIVSPLGLGRAAVDLLGWPPRRWAAAHAGADRAVAEITRGRLGREVTELLVDPLIGGIHAGDTTQMSAAAVFPSLLDAAARGGSLMRGLRGAAAPVTSGHTDAYHAAPPVFLTVRGGLSRLIDALADALGARGVELCVRSPVTHIELCNPDGEPVGMKDVRNVSSLGAVSSLGDEEAPWALRTPLGTVVADAVVVATAAGAAAALLGPVDHSVAAMLGAIDYSDVTVVTLQVPEEGVGRPLEGTGFLVPSRAGCLITACTWLTSKWPELKRPGDVVLRASIGRFGDDRAAPLSDHDIVRRVLVELGPMLDLRSPPTQAVVTRWAEAFPQYAVGHVERVAAIEAAVARLPRLALAGAAFHGVGIPACIASGRKAAGTVLGRSVVAGQTTR